MIKMLAMNHEPVQVNDWIRFQDLDTKQLRIGQVQYFGKSSENCPVIYTDNGACYHSMVLEIRRYPSIDYALATEINKKESSKKGKK